MTTVKQQVLKVYPDAVCEWDYNVLGTHSVRYSIQSGWNTISTYCDTEEQAWQNALNNLTTAQEANKAK